MQNQVIKFEHEHSGKSSLNGCFLFIHHILIVFDVCFDGCFFCFRSECKRKMWNFSNNLSFSAFAGQHFPWNWIQMSIMFWICVCFFALVRDRKKLKVYSKCHIYVIWQAHFEECLLDNFILMMLAVMAAKCMFEYDFCAWELGRNYVLSKTWEINVMRRISWQK